MTRVVDLYCFDGCPSWRVRPAWGCCGRAWWGSGAAGRDPDAPAGMLERASVLAAVHDVHRRKNPAPSSSSGSTTQVLHPMIAARPATSGTTAS
jgi:hypothetical protein